MTTTDSESKIYAVNQEFAPVYLAKDEMYAPIAIDDSQINTNVYTHSIDDSGSYVNLNELAHTVHEMKKKLDVLTEHFEFLFTQFDKSE